MNKIAKQLVAIFVGVLFFAGSVVAQPGQPGSVPEGPAPEGQTGVPVGCPFSATSLDITATDVCYLPALEAFVVIDSIDCAVDLLIRDADSMCRIGRFTTDVYQGRHDLQNIIRPKSVSVMDGKIIVLASSQRDTAYLAVLDLNPAEDGTLPVLNKVGLNSTAYAFSANHIADEIIVVDKNSVGYNIHILDIHEGLEKAVEKSNYHYHVPKQSERILASDPHGFGLAIVAILVVFIALVCIMLLMMLFSAIVRRSTEKKAGKPAVAKGPSIGAIASGVDGEVYAAIAAAIYAYEQDLHDEEDTIITIQKVERAWTPWNAKFYNMNHYFSNR